MRSFFERNVAEIGESRALRLYGALLACGNLLTFYFWNRSYPLASVLSDRADPICWPFAPDCEWLHFGTPGQAQAALWLFGAFAAAAVVFFATRPAWTRRAYWSLAACEALKLFFLAVDYRVLMVHHYMSLFAAATFLLLPSKERTGSALLVLFYFWAGVLKCNPQWLSGETLRAFWKIRPDWLPQWCVLAIVLECGLSWLLLSPRAALFWPVLALFAVFHALSWPVVGSYYPLLMVCLLSLLPLARLLGAAPRGRLPAASAAWLLFFCALQAAPYLYPADIVLRGGGRLFYGLWMFAPEPECRFVVDEHWRDGPARQSELELPEIRTLNFRLHCQPLIAWNMARHRCARLSEEPGFTDLDLAVYARRRGRLQWQLVVDAPRFCSEPPDYRLLAANRWIRRQEGDAP